MKLLKSKKTWTILVISAFASATIVFTVLDNKQKSNTIKEQQEEIKELRVSLDESIDISSNYAAQNEVMEELVAEYKVYIEKIQSEHKLIQDRLKQTMPEQ